MRTRFEPQGFTAESIRRAWTKEDMALLEAGFKPTENRLLWEERGILYGREAALQKAWRKQGEEEIDSR